MNQSEPAKYHKPVLVDAIVASLFVQKARWIVDVTLGDGGYAKRILEKMPVDGCVIGIDQDAEALWRARKRLSAFGDRLMTVEGNFRHLEALLAQRSIDQVDAIVADLGVSYLQITDPKKGFTFSQPGPLLMHMDQKSQLTAADVINDLSEKELVKIFKDFGEERQARPIARAIMRARLDARIENTEALKQIVLSVIRPPHAIKSVARIFQSIRIYVNQELDALKEFLPQALRLLKPGGRLAVVSYHSLEDRMVKEFITTQVQPCVCPPDFPVCVCGKKPQMRWVKKLVRPDEAEIQENPSARSAKCRIAEKI